jgi:hypothetical protein
VPAAFNLQGRFQVLFSVRGRVNLRTMVGLERLGKLKKLNDVIGTGISEPLLNKPFLLSTYEEFIPEVIPCIF